MYPNAIEYAKHRSRPHDAVIRVYDGAGNVSEMHERAPALERIVTPDTKSRHALKRDGGL
jgi:hypothetical protein